MEKNLSVCTPRQESSVDHGGEPLCVSPSPESSDEHGGEHISVCVPTPSQQWSMEGRPSVCPPSPESAVEHGGSPSLGPHTQSQQRSMKGKPSLCVPQVQTQQSSMEGRIGVGEGSHWWPHQAHHTSLMSVLHSHSYSEMNERKSFRL